MPFPSLVLVDTAMTAHTTAGGSSATSDLTPLGLLF